MAKNKEHIDITTDAGQKELLNRAVQDFESGGDRMQAMTRSTLVGRGISIRTLRLREAAFNKERGKGTKRG